MHRSIPLVCRAIAEDNGGELLALMSHVYAGADRIREDSLLAVLEQAVGLDLIVSVGDRLSLTPTGYLVGNVAKEYCNWIEHDRRMPPPRPAESLLAGRDVLDVGCSFGRWLFEFQPVARSVLGIEMQGEYIELGKAIALRESLQFPEVRQGTAEDLDVLVAPTSVDFVFCRLVLNHVEIRKTLAKVSGVLRPGGIAWLQVGTFWQAVKTVCTGERRLRSRAFAIFAVMNSLICITTGRQLALPVRGRMHAVHKPANPTIGWWRRTCREHGLDDFVLEWYADGVLAFQVRKR